MNARHLAVALGMFAALVSPLANAEPSSLPPKPAGTHKAPKSALASLADDVVSALGNVPNDALVVGAPLASDLETARGDALVGRLRDHIARRLDHAHAHPTPASREHARTAATRASALIYVEVELLRGELRVSADVFILEKNSWDRVRRSAAPPTAHAYAHAPMDAEIRSFFSPIPLEKAAIQTAKHDESDVLAIACGDLDDDGGVELILASRSRIVVGKLRGDRLVLVRHADWSRLARLSPTPLRQPLATVAVPHGRSEALVGISDRGGLALSASLAPLRTLVGIPIADSHGERCARLSPELGAFDSPLLSCDGAAFTDASASASPTPRFDAVASLSFASSDGAMSHVVAAREPSGMLRLRWGDGYASAREHAIDGAGAQLALADLDLDGSADLATTMDGSGEDAISIWSLGPEGVSLRRRIPTKAPVRALAACPPEERGLPALVAVVGSEVWWVR